MPSQTEQWCCICSKSSHRCTNCRCAKEHIPCRNCRRGSDCSNPYSQPGRGLSGEEDGERPSTSDGSRNGNQGQRGVSEMRAPAITHPQTLQQQSLSSSSSEPAVPAAGPSLPQAQDTPPHSQQQVPQPGIDDRQTERGNLI